MQSQTVCSHLVVAEFDVPSTHPTHLTFTNVTHNHTQTCTRQATIYTQPPPGSPTGRVMRCELGPHGQLLPTAGNPPSLTCFTRDVRLRRPSGLTFGRSCGTLFVTNMDGPAVMRFAGARCALRLPCLNCFTEARNSSRAVLQHIMSCEGPVPWLHGVPLASIVCSALFS